MKITSTFFKISKITTSFLFLCLLFNLSNLYAKNSANNIDSYIGKNDAFILADQNGKIIYGVNIDKPLIPASTIKILTALSAFHYLGANYRYQTEFYIDQKSNLKIKGYGDPLLISEIINEISFLLSQKITAHLPDKKSINHIIVDDSFFIKPILIPGRSRSFQPYDAPNGALCANFNTVNFFRNSSGKYISAEPQTPLLKFILDRVDDSSLDKGRIVLSNCGESTLYTGHLFKYFLNANNINVQGKIIIGNVDHTQDRLILKYTSPYTLNDIIIRLLEYSNNFTANQLLITCGIKAYGAPGTLEKGVKAVRIYSKNILGLNDIKLYEGSGLSRKNKISATMMLKILNNFEPYHDVMRVKNQYYYKTGTLEGVRAKVGYIKKENGALYRFAIFLNTPGKSMDSIFNKIAGLK